MFQAPGKTIAFDKECGVTKGCFPNCPNGCQYLVTWQKLAQQTNSDDSVRFTLSMELDSTNDVWMAVGISKTGQMV